MSLHPVSPEPRTPPRLALLRSWSNLRVGSDGFSLTELLIGSAVTLIVMALALQVMTIMYSVHRRESRIAEVSSGVVRALDDMLSEIGRAGYGLGDSDRIDFAEPGQGFRLTRYFYPIENPAAVATPPFADWGVILSQGRNPSQDRSCLYTFLTQKRFLEARVENVTVLEERREPVALAFGPDPRGLFGSLFLVSSGARSGSVARLQLNEDGVLSPESAPKIFEATEELAQARGVAGGVDGALYITTSLKSAIVRYRFDDSGQPMGPEELARLPGRPGAIARGAEGALYFIMDSAVSGADPSDIWKVPFNRSLEPEPPLRIATLSGKGLSLALEPVSGQLFALVRERLGDFVILRLPALWLRTGVGEPETVFSSWKSIDQV